MRTRSRHSPSLFFTCYFIWSWSLSFDYFWNINACLRYLLFMRRACFAFGVSYPCRIPDPAYVKYQDLRYSIL